MNGVDMLIVNKMDVLRKVGVWQINDGWEGYTLKDEEQFRKFLKQNIRRGVSLVFSDRPDAI
jgi:hypothetical protein